MRILTFDIEDWFHILDTEATRTENEWNIFESRIHRNMDRIFELLDRKKQKATFFCLGWIAARYPEIIRKIDFLGYELAAHSNMHQLAYEQTRDEFKADLETNVKTLEDITGKKIRAYRVPGFSISKRNKWIFEVLVESGIEIDCSVFPARRGHGGFAGFGAVEPSIVEVNGVRIKEFPINIYRFFGLSIVFSGGGYFRLLPYRIIKHMMKRSDYVMTYFHPRDFDPDQPVIGGLPFTRKFKSYYGLRSAFRKLERLIGDFEFVDLNTADKLLNWKDARVVKF